MHLATVVLCVILSVTAFTGQVVSDDDVNADYYFTRGQSYSDMQNYPEAAKWFLKAAELGHAGAQSDLSVLYFKGHGVQQDYNEALKWARLAADQGYARGQAYIGYMYHLGRGVPQSHTEAEKWYLMAANQRFHHATLLLANLHVEKGDYVTALAWATVAVETSQNDDEYYVSRDTARDIIGIGRDKKIHGEQYDQAEALANSLLQDIP